MIPSIILFLALFFSIQFIDIEVVKNVNNTSEYNTLLFVLSFIISALWATFWYFSH